MRKIILALSGAALYEALRSRMAVSAGGHMQTTLEALQVDLASVRATTDISNHPHVWTDQMDGHQNMDMAIYDMAGNRLVGTSGFQTSAVLRDLSSDTRTAAFDTRGARFRYLTAVTRLAGAGCVSVRVVVQYDKRDVETMKLIKLDLLGLGMLAAIDECIQLIEHDCAVCLDVARDAQQMYSSGASVRDIRAAIEKKWAGAAARGTHTHTPEPPKSSP